LYDVFVFFFVENKQKQKQIKKIGPPGPTGAPGAAGAPVFCTPAVFSVFAPSTVNGSTGVIQNWTPDVDSLSGFNDATGVYTVTQAGTYELEVQATLTSSLVGLSVNPKLNIRINGAVVSTSTDPVNLSLLSALSFTLTTFVVTNLSVGDTIDSTLTSIASLSLSSSATNGTQFFGVRLGGCSGPPGPTGAAAGPLAQFAWSAQSNSTTVPYVGSPNSYYYLGSNSTAAFTAAVSPTSALGRDVVQSNGWRPGFIPHTVTIEWDSSAMASLLVIPDLYRISVYYSTPAGTGGPTSTLVNTTSMTSATQPNGGTITLPASLFAGAAASSAWSIVVDTTAGTATAANFILSGVIQFS
jgi:hypothetical protein